MEGILIKDAAKKLNVEAHVLRYWEEELKLNIKRNSMGHRYYDDNDIRLFKEINDLRESGVSLKDIKNAIESVRRDMKVDDNSNEDGNVNGMKIDGEDIKESYEENGDDIDKDGQNGKKEIASVEETKIVDFKGAQLQNIMNKIVANALNENKKIITTSIKAELSQEIIKQFDYIIKEKEEREEERFRKLDENIRKLQQAEMLIAATKAKKKSWWRK